MNKRRRYKAKLRRAERKRGYTEVTMRQTTIAHSYGCWPNDVDLAIVLAAI